MTTIIFFMKTYKFEIVQKINLWASLLVTENQHVSRYFVRKICYWPPSWISSISIVYGLSWCQHSLLYKRNSWQLTLWNW